MGISETSDASEFARIFEKALGSELAVGVGWIHKRPRGCATHM